MMPMYFILLLAVPATLPLFIADPKIPYMTQLGNGLMPGHKITVTGLVLPTANNFGFSINLREGYQKDGLGTIPFHFNVRFFQPNYVVFNTLSPQTGWLEEEKIVAPIPFEKGYPFTLEILCEDDQFLVSVDREPFYEYKYRLPLALADVLDIHGVGQIELSLIDVNQDESF